MNIKQIYLRPDGSIHSILFEDTTNGQLTVKSFQSPGIFEMQFPRLTMLEIIAMRYKLRVSTYRKDLLLRMQQNFRPEEFIALVEIVFSEMEPQQKQVLLSKLNDPEHLERVKNAS